MTTITCLIVWMPPATSGRARMGVAATVPRGTAFAKTAPTIKAEVAPTLARRIHVVAILLVALSTPARFRSARKRHPRVGGSPPSLDACRSGIAPFLLQPIHV